VALRALVQHRDDRTDDLQMAQFLRRNIEKQVLAARIIFTDGLGEITTCGSQFPLRATKLL
jgi:hypothetical protein